jgi:predicted nucleic acid-binding protein
MGGRSRRIATPPTVIVVDTTVWIDFLEARGTAFDRHLAALIQDDAPISLVEIVYAEVLQGIRDDEVFQQIRMSLRAHPILRPQGLHTFETAANLYRAARRRGLTIRRSVDCLIAATCLESGAEIYHNDRDFDALARVSDLMIYRPA